MSLLIYLVVTDSTVSMGTLCVYFQDIDLEYGYYTDNTLHHNIIIAFKGGWLCVMFCTLCSIVSSDSNTDRLIRPHHIGCQRGNKNSTYFPWMFLELNAG